MTNEIRTAMRQREDDEDKCKLIKAARNMCNQVRHNAKRRHTLYAESSSLSNIWNFLNTQGIGKRQHQVFNHKICLDDFNRHSSSTTEQNLQTKS